MPDYHLIPHPAHSSSTVAAITVSAIRPARDRIELIYRIEGDLAAIRWPDRAAPAFAHALWMHSCCEAFVGGEKQRYTELNVSPSTRYAVYDFDGYRTGMRDAFDVEVAIDWDGSTGTLIASATIPRLAAADAWPLALSVVIEELSGAKSYWALTHPAPEPDFHNAACFTATLPAPAAP